MSKELPYFKFFTGEWLNGDITLEDYELQGLFINVCAYYWHRDCEATYEQLSKKFRSNRIVDLIPEFLKCDDETNQISIRFLDEQFSEFTSRKKKLSDAGKRGAKIKKQLAMNKPPLNEALAFREEEEEEKEKTRKKTIEERRKDFSESLLNFIPDYDAKMVNEFFLYWSEHGENDKKMRFEKQTSFSIERRLGTWKRNEQNFKNGTKNNTSANRAVTTKSERQSFE